MLKQHRLHQPSLVSSPEPSSTGTRMCTCSCTNSTVCQTSSGVLSAGFESMDTRRQGPIGEGPEEGHFPCFKPESPGLWRTPQGGGLRTLEERRHQADMHLVDRILTGTGQLSPGGPRETQNATKPLNVMARHGRLEQRSNFFSVRVTESWNRKDKKYENKLQF